MITRSEQRHRKHRDSLRRELSFDDDGDDEIIFIQPHRPTTSTTTTTATKGAAKSTHVSPFGNAIDATNVINSWCLVNPKNSISTGQTAPTTTPISSNGTSKVSPDHQPCVTEQTILYGEESLAKHTQFSFVDLILFLSIFTFCFAAIYYTYAFFGYTPVIILFSGGVSLFSWTITYFDSMQPGIMPPSPLSPAHYRQLSGHTFHLGYTMSIFNGLATFIILWLNRDYDWISAVPPL